MRKQTILAVLGFSMFFLVLTVFYTLMILTDGQDSKVAPFMPAIVLSGFFIFLIGAILVASAISKKIFPD